jgi:cysteine synthase A
VDRNPTAQGLAEADESLVCDIIDDSAIAEAASKRAADIILPLNDFGVPTAARVSASLKLPSISIEASHAATNKEKMREIWSREGLPCPKYRVERAIVRIASAIEEIGLPVILKPAHGIGGGSRGVVVVTEKSQMLRAIEISQCHYDDKTTIIEQFVPGVSEHSSEFLVVDGEPKLIAIGDKQKTPLPFRVDTSVIYPTTLSVEQRQQVQEIGSQAIKSLGIDRGTVHLEFSWSDGSLMLFELGARSGGGATSEPIVRYLTGISLIVEQAKSIANLPTNTVRNVEERSCVYRFLTPKPGRLKSIDGWNEISRNPAVLDAYLGVNVGDEVPPLQIGTDRVGFFVAAGSRREEVLDLANTLERQLTFSYC